MVKKNIYTPLVASFFAMGASLNANANKLDNSIDNPLIRMTDGPGMVNSFYWKHDILNGAWVTPNGKYILDINGFDFTFGVYQSDVDNHFVNVSSRFWFDGSQRSQNREKRFDLKVMNDFFVTRSDGQKICKLINMYHEKDSIYVEIEIFPSNEKLTEIFMKPEKILE